MSIFSDIIILGLTGQSGAGKSTVSDLIQSRGISVIDADGVSRKVAAYPHFLKEVGELYPECVGENGLDRKMLASIVFNSPVKLKAYTDIIYPYITRELFRQLDAIKENGEKIAILDAPTLFESGLNEICKGIISVIAPDDIKTRRLLKRDGITLEMIKSRLSAQRSEEFFRGHSDLVITNDAGISELELKVEAVIEQIKERFDV